MLQHLEVGAQLAWKAARLRRALAAHPALASVPVDAGVASPRALGYRNRSKLVCAARGGRVVLGAFAPRSHDVIDLAGCRVSEAPLEAVAGALRGLLAEGGVAPYEERTFAGDLRHVVLRANHAGEVLAILVVARPDAPGVAELARRLRALHPEDRGRRRERQPHARQRHLRPGRRGASPWRAPAGSTSAWARCACACRRGPSSRRTARSPGWPTPPSRAPSRRARASASSTPTAASAASRSRSRAARPASTSSASRSTPPPSPTPRRAPPSTASPGARFVAGDVAVRLREVPRADVVVLNPPRKGCGAAALEQVARLGPRVVAYLSCDPDTLARDLALLSERRYRVRSVTPFDMLPHTPHVEALAVLDDA